MAESYVLGFCFYRRVSFVAVHKRSSGPPAAVAGRVNGVGGAIEPGEEPLAAMQREFLEETGLACDWEPFCCIQGATGWRVYCYRAFVDGIGWDPSPQNDSGERIFWCGVDFDRPILDPDGGGALKLVENLPWLVALALSGDDGVPVTVLENYWPRPGEWRS